MVNFHRAAINLGLIQEAEGSPGAALTTWTGALQPDDARTALLNQSARVLEKAGRLAEAERTLRASLLTTPAQPDAIQHWVHLRQRMCQWPILAGEAVGLPEAELIADCGPLAAHGLSEDAFVFCCCSNHYKVTQAMFTAWMAILGRVPNSVLWLAADNGWSQRNMHAEARRLGVDPGRLVFADRTDPASYIRRLGVADLYLDTFPYAAGTIASDAIRMGLPIVTLRGEAFASRMAARLLDAVGAHEGVTDTLAGYVDRAVALGTQPDAYVRYRSLFTEQTWQATIGNTARFVSEYEATLLDLHSRLRQDAGAE